MMENLTLPLEVGRRGIATPAPQALLVAAGSAGMFQGWLAMDEISGGADLRSRFVSGPTPSRDELAACSADCPPSPRCLPHCLSGRRA